ncbi:serine hydrolase domain-containing protein [Actinocorallia populi]|uniref:serine hydrolase domain-containing protein n=1 Tax=Actinocorallia populi TaxID=2079200 RepID=UPI000D08D390|nr:serine hydrolase domain-containing protein [Actinocorallia populi]
MRDRLRHAAASVAALLFCLLFCVPVASASTGSDRYAAIDAYVRDRMEATHVPGLSYAVVGPDGPLHQRSWGTDGRGGPVTAGTPFLWGSVAKPVAATGVMALVQDGRLGLDDRVVDHLPGFRFGGTAHAAEVTVRHLLDQTAGLPASATFAVADCLSADCPRPAERIGALDDVRPLGPPGTAYAYTSANYLVLAAVVEAVTGLPFAEHLRRAVLDPAGMDGAIADAASARKRDLPPGHQLLWGLPSAIADGYDDHGASYGYLGGDLNDLAAFASLQLRSGRTADGGTVLTPQSVRLMRREGELRPTGAGTGYGLGWRVGGLDAPLDGAVWHTGATFGYSAMIFLLPEQGTALVLHQNLHGLLHDGAVMQAGFGAARLLAGGDPPAAPSASPYHLAVWGTTVLALALTAAAVRSAFLLRRPSLASPPRRAAVAAAWILAGALPWIVAVPLVVQMGPGHLWNWFPDISTALCAGAVAGAATAALRLVRAVRGASGRQAFRTTGGDGAS